MDSGLRTLLAAQDGIVTRSQAERIGITGMDLTRLVRRGSLIRAAQGGYVDAELYAALEHERQHALRARAVLATVPEAVVLSHYSAAAAYGLPLVGVVPATVQLTRLSEGPNRSCASHRIHRPYPGATASVVDGLRVIEPAYALLGVGAGMGRQAVVAASDVALARGLVTEVAIQSALELCPRWPGHRILRAALPWLDGRAESPGESLTRLLLIDLGYVVEPQVEIANRAGRVIARVDFLLSGAAVVVEFDGRSKYVDSDTSSGQRVLAQEKDREDALRSLGYEVVRLVWSDLGDAAGVRRRIEDAMTRAGRGRSRADERNRTEPDRSRSEPEGNGPDRPTAHPVVTGAR